MRQITLKKPVASVSSLGGSARVVFAATFACFMSAASLSAQGSTNVFNDAVFWFRGGKDKNKDTYMQQGEFFDDLHANDANHNNHKMGVLPYTSSALAAGFKANAVFRNETVVFPALGSQIAKSIPVLHFSDTVIPYSGKNYHWPQFVKPHSVFSSNNISNEYTIVGRIKLDDDNYARTQCVFKVGYDASTSQGMWLGFSELDKTAKTKYITGRCTPGSGSNDAQFDFTDIRIPTNTWFDIAVVVGNGKLRVGISVPKTYGDNPTIIFAATNMWTGNCQLLGAESCYRLFSLTGQESQQSSVASIDMTFFIGSVQQIAIWGRALTDQEVMEAFGMPRPAIFRTGLDNGSSNEFSGTRSGSTQMIDGIGSWQNVANTMRAGDTWTVNFTALRDEAGLAQIFSIKSLGGSNAAQIEPMLSNASHNISLGVRRVAANGRTFWPVPADIITEGANALIIKRMDGEAGDFLVDAMELGGSLGVGIETGSITDDQRVSPERMKTGVPSAADPNTQHWPQGLLPSSGITNLHFRVWMDPDVVDKVTSRFWTHTRRKEATQGTETFTLFVNGEPKTNSLSSASWEETELTFQPGGLNGGWNDFEFISPSYPTCYWEFGYYRFETVLPKGFSIPPPGMTIVIK